MLVLGAIALGSCDDRWEHLDAPRLVQLTCRFEDPAEVVTLQLDTGRAKASRMNGPEKAEGRLVMDERTYQVALPSAGAVPEQRLIVNRYDGSVERKIGASARASSQTGRCTKMKAEPLF